MYNMGNFEHSLVNFHKAMRYSTTREKGKLSRCIERTELAVLNAVGPQVSHYFKNLDKILVHITKTNILGLPWHKVRNVCAPKDTGRGAKVKDRKFLSELATDKRYLEGLAKNLKNENSGVGQIQKEEIVREVKITFYSIAISKKHLCISFHFFRQTKPLSSLMIEEIFGASRTLNIQMKLKVIKNKSLLLHRVN